MNQTQKRKRMLTVAAVGLGGLALFAFSKAKTANNLTFFLGDIKAAFRDGRPVLDIGLGINNPGSGTLSVDSLAGSLFAGGVEIGRVVSAEPMQIAAKSSGVYPVRVELSLGGIAADLFNLLQNGNGIQQTVIFKGEVLAEGIPIPIPFVLEYKIF